MSKRDRLVEMNSIDNLLKFPDAVPRIVEYYDKQIAKAKLQAYEDCLTISVKSNDLPELRYHIAKARLQAYEDCLTISVKSNDLPELRYHIKLKKKELKRGEDD